MKVTSSADALRKDGEGRVVLDVAAHLVRCPDPAQLLQLLPHSAVVRLRAHLQDAKSDASSGVGAAAMFGVPPPTVGGAGVTLLARAERYMRGKYAPSPRLSTFSSSTEWSRVSQHVLAVVSRVMPAVEQELRAPSLGADLKACVSAMKTVAGPCRKGGKPKAPVAPARIDASSLVGHPDMLRGLATCVPGTERLVVECSLAAAASTGAKRKLAMELVDAGSKPAVNCLLKLLKGFDGSAESVGFADVAQLSDALLDCVAEGWLHLQRREERERFLRAPKVPVRNRQVSQELWIAALQCDDSAPAYMKRATEQRRKSADMPGVACTVHLRWLVAQPFADELLDAMLLSVAPEPQPMVSVPGWPALESRKGREWLVDPGSLDSMSDVAIEALKALLNKMTAAGGPARWFELEWALNGLTRANDWSSALTTTIQGGDARKAKHAHRMLSRMVAAKKINRARARRRPQASRDATEALDFPR